MAVLAYILSTLPSILYKVWLLINRSICLSTTITEVQLNHAILHRFQLRHVFDLQWWSRYIRRPTTVVPTIGFESPCSRTRVVAESTILLSFVVCRGSHTRSSLQCSPWSIYYNEATPRERSDRLLFFTLGRSVSAWIDYSTTKWKMKSLVLIGVFFFFFQLSCESCMVMDVVVQNPPKSSGYDQGTTMTKKHVSRDFKLCCCCRFCCCAPTTDERIHAPVLHDASQIDYFRYWGRASLPPITSRSLHDGQPSPS